MAKSQQNENVVTQNLDAQAASVDLCLNPDNNFADEKEFNEGPKNQNDKDELYQSAVDIIKSEGKASTSFLQRKLQIGYNRAARIIDMM